MRQLNIRLAQFIIIALLIVTRGAFAASIVSTSVTVSDNDGNGYVNIGDSVLIAIEADSNVYSPTVDFSSLGGSATAAMTNTTGNTYTASVVVADAGSSGIDQDSPSITVTLQAGADSRVTIPYHVDSIAPVVTSSSITLANSILTNNRGYNNLGDNWVNPGDVVVVQWDKATSGEADNISLVRFYFGPIGGGEVDDTDTDGDGKFVGAYTVGYGDTHDENLKIYITVQDDNGNTTALVPSGDTLKFDNQPPDTPNINVYSTPNGVLSPLKIGDKITIIVEETGGNELSDVSDNYVMVDLRDIGDSYTSTEYMGAKKTNIQTGIEYFQGDFTIYEGALENRISSEDTFTITIIDDAGNVAYMYLPINKGNYTWIDNTPPQIYLSTAYETFVDADNSGIANIGDTLIFQVRVSKTDGETLSGNVKIDVTSLDSSGNYYPSAQNMQFIGGGDTVQGTFLIYSGNLEDENGATNFLLTVQDDVGNETSAYLSFVVDNKPPAAPILSEISDTTLSTNPSADNTFQVWIKSPDADVNSQVGAAKIIGYTDSNILAISRVRILTGDTYGLNAFSYNGDSWVSNNTLKADSSVDGKEYFNEIVIYDNAGNYTVYYDTSNYYYIDSEIALGTINAIIDKTPNSFDDDETHPVMSTNSDADDTFYVQVSVRYPSPQTYTLPEMITRIEGYFKNSSGGYVNIIQDTNGTPLYYFSSENWPSMPQGVWTSPSYQIYQNLDIDGYNYYIEYVLYDDYGNTASLKSPEFDIDSNKPYIVDWWPNSDTLTNFSPADLYVEQDLSSTSLNNDPSNPDSDLDDFVFYYVVKDAEQHLNYVQTAKTFQISSNINTLVNYYQTYIADSGYILFVVNDDGSKDPIKIPGSYNMSITVYDKAGNYVQVLKSFEYDNKAPVIRSTLPENGAYVRTKLDSVVVVVYDYTGDIDLDNSSVWVEKLGEKVSGSLSYETQVIGSALQVTYYYRFTQPLLTDGEYDGQYSIVYSVRDSEGNILDNQGQNNLAFIFDATPPTYSGSNHPVPGQIVTAGVLADITDINSNGDTTEDYVLANVFDKTSGIDYNRSDIVIYRVRDGVKVGGISNPKFSDKLVAFFDNLPDSRLATDGSDDGRYNQLIHLWDKAGNFTTITQPFIYDTQKPVINDLADPYKIYFAVLNENEDVTVDIKIYDSQIKVDDYSGATILDDLKETDDDVLVKTFNSITTSPGNNEIYWDGRSDGGGILDINKVYRYEVVATDIAGNKSDTAVGYIIIDKEPPIIANVNVNPNPFTPTLEKLSISFTTNENSLGSLEIYDPSGNRVLKSGVLVISGGVNKIYEWDGIDATTGEPYAPGVYKFVITAKDKAGNEAKAFTGYFEITQKMPTIKAVSVKPNPFSPNGDGIEDTTQIDVVIANETYTQTVYLDYGSYEIDLQFEPLLKSIRLYNSSGNLVSLEEGISFLNGETGSKIVINDFKDTPLKNLGDTYTVIYTARNKVSVVAKIFDLSGKNEIRTLYREDKDGDGVLDPGEDENGNGVLDNEPAENRADADTILVSFVFDGRYEDNNPSDNEPGALLPEGDYIYRIYTEDKQLNVQTIVRSGIITISYSSLTLKIIDYTINPEKFIPDGDGKDDYANIGFTINKDAYVTLKIYDADLVLVRTLLLNQYKTAGSHKVFWDGRNDAGELLPSSDYYAKIVAADITTTEADQLEEKVTIGNTWLGDYEPYPPADSYVNYVDRVYYTISAIADTGIDLGNSNVTLEGPNGEIVGTVSSSSSGDSGLIELKLKNPLPRDGSADGEYKLILNALKKVTLTDTTYSGPKEARIIKKFIFDSQAPKLVSVASGEASVSSHYTNDLSSVKAYISDNLSGLQAPALPNTLFDSADVTYDSFVEMLKTDSFTFTGSLLLLFGPEGSLIKANDASNIDKGLFGLKDINLARDGTQDGTYTLVILPKDKAGNAGAYQEFKFYYDTIRPQISINIDEIPINFTPQYAPAYASVDGVEYPTYSGEYLPITVSANEELSTMPQVIVQQNGAPAVVVKLSTSDSKTWQGKYRLNKQYTGVATISISAEDRAGNRTPTYTSKFVVAGSALNVNTFAVAPNPFKDETNFLFDLTTPSAVEVNLFTLAGEHIKRITRSNLQTDRIVWDGTDDNGLRVPSGAYIYIVKIKAGKETVQKKGVCIYTK